MSNRAWVTLATNDSYGLGALVLAHSLRRSSSAYPAVVLITPSVTEAMRNCLRAVFAEVVTVDVLDSRDAAHLALLQRPELGITFTKLHCWNLTQYEKCVFLDADTLIVQNCDELFEREELSAAPDVGWPDCFNSGVFVFNPSADTFSKLIAFASERGSFDGGDQGLLNSYFSDWAHGDIKKHLPFLYNVTSAAFYSYIPALKHYGQNLKIIHFIGATKPWLQQYNWESRRVEAAEHLRDFLQLWWDLFTQQVHSQLDVNMDQMQYGFLDFTVDDRKYSVIPFIKSSGTIPSHCKLSSHRYNMCSKHTPQDSTIEEEVEANIEEQPTTMLQEGVIDYKGPVLNYGLYEPLLDAESQFPWHHPENQILYEEINVPEIDMNQYHDPWDIFRGNIPPGREDSKPTEANEYEDMRKYAWDYASSQHSQYQIQISHNYEHSPDYHKPFEHQYTVSQTESQITQHHYQEQSWQYSAESSQNVHQHSENTLDFQHDYNKDDSQQHMQWHDQHETQHFQNQSDQQYQEQHYPHEHHYTSEHHYTHVDQPKHYNQQIADQNQESLVQNNHILHSHEIVHNEKQSKNYNKIHSFTYSQLENQNVSEQVYTVMMDHIRMRNPTSGEKVNGCASDTESDTYEDVSPRHPYDDFYLRHRMTIDSRGRKICIHEVPYIPSTSSSVSFEDFEDALETLDDNDKTLIDDVQTGVAGNLARVVPGSPLQREAVDELARRQGWEAGNIDYMGADSFDNIWAKISQTLSQPPTTPAEQSPPSEQQSSPPEQQSSPPEQQSPQAETKPEQPSEPVIVEAIKDAEPLIEKESVIEVAAAKVADAPLETQAPDEVPKSEQNVAAPLEIESAPVAASETAESKSVPVPAEVAADVSVVESAPVDVVNSESVQEIPVAAIEALTLDESEPKSAAAASEPVAVSDAIPEPLAQEPVATEPVPAAPESAPVIPEPVPVVPEPAPAAPESAPAALVSAPAVPEPAPAVPEPLPSVAEVVPAKAAAPVPQVTKTKPEATSDSPPLANTPSKEEIPRTPAAKSEERRKPAGKLQLPAPVADALLTPDSELEDAATLAHAIIASELRSPTVTSSSPPVPPATSPPASDESRLSVQGPEVPTPPVSLSQIGVKPKPSTAAQIESSLTKNEPKSTETETPKKKVVKKVKSKESASSEVPVPPPRKKEKKPKEK